MKNLIKEIDNRIASIQKEQEFLMQLRKLYATPLVSITSEPEPEPIKTQQEIADELQLKIQKIQTQPLKKFRKSPTYEEPLEIIFASLPNPLTLPDIQNSLNILTDQELDSKQTHCILRYFIKHHKIKHLSWNSYTWIGGNKNGTKTLPNGGSTEIKTI